MSFWADKNKEDIETLFKSSGDLRSKIELHALNLKRVDEQLLATRKEMNPNMLFTLASQEHIKSLEDIRSRLDKIELWKGEIHRLLTTETPNTGRPKLTSQGKFLRGVYNHR